MEEDAEALSRSDDWSDRVRAAKIAAAGDPAATEELLLRLLRDVKDTGVTEAAVLALLEARGADAVPVILRALGREPSDEDEDESGWHMLVNLSFGAQFGVDVEAAVTSALLTARDRDTTLGSLDAIRWLAPGRRFDPPPEALALMNRLAAGDDAELRQVARSALDGVRQGLERDSGRD
jgi:HEAT repeat protein